MFISQETHSILKNFATINQNLLIKAGSSLRTLSSMKDLLGEAVVTETFERDVPIYDLSQFLNCLSLIPGAEVNLLEDYIQITDGSNSINYRYAEPSVIQTPPDKELSLPSEDVCFVLKQEDLETVKKAAAVLQIPDVSLKGDGETIKIVVSDKKNSGSNSYQIEVGQCDTEFEFVFKVESLKIISGDYDVVISSSMLSRFTHQSSNIKYYIAIDPSNSFYNS
ncbi:sliding clamp [Synechococcus phage S-CRM01]|uniref:DNA polymerase processivity factor n=1 Tax=Synechococcus phage S-CRM01 TaxID=1026955 RepID=UPI000209E3ED|nr:DNA polymerase processivity factor [Synechococcus phage S-CRM01]AEC53102.1 sliding clamp [Synechococcus phage S-CRM01]